MGMYVLHYHPERNGGKGLATRDQVTKFFEEYGAPGTNFGGPIFL